MAYPRPLGAPVPWFSAHTHGNPKFAFSSLGGRFVLLLFLPSERAAARAVADHLLANEKLFAPGRCVAFAVLRDPELFAELPERAAVRWVLDGSGDISRPYGALAEDGVEAAFWLLIDPTLRALAHGELTDLPAELGRLSAIIAGLPPPERHAGIEIHAPVLIVPRVFEPAFCRELIAYYEVRGGKPSGVMRLVNGLTTGVMDDSFKRRRDAVIEDEGLMAGIRARLRERLIPEIQRAFAFKVTRVERYIVAAYDASEGGHFRAHRDNDSPGTAHRRFACSINLNAEDFEGGDLRFPEYGTRTYRPPTGGAVVFSCSLLHEVSPITRGRRYATLPFLYDEEGARVRGQNAHLVDENLRAAAKAAARGEARGQAPAPAGQGA